MTTALEDYLAPVLSKLEDLHRKKEEGSSLWFSGRANKMVELYREVILSGLEVTWFEFENADENPYFVVGLRNEAEAKRIVEIYKKYADAVIYEGC